MQNGHLPGEAMEGSFSKEGPRGTLHLPSLPACTGSALGSPRPGLLHPATSQMALLGFTADSAVQVNRELWAAHLAGFGASGCNSRGQSSQRSRGSKEQIKLELPSCPHPAPGALSTPSPHWTWQKSGLPDLPSRWEQHKEPTFHAPHQAHAERLRGFKEQLIGRATSSKQKVTGVRVVLIKGVLG